MDTTLYIRSLKESNRPESKAFYDKPYDKGGNTRRATRPWDNVWFSNKPHIINLTVEQAISAYPSYMLWCYANLRINWSVYTRRLFDKIKPKDFKFNY